MGEGVSAVEFDGPVEVSEGGLVAPHDPQGRTAFATYPGSVGLQLHCPVEVFQSLRAVVRLEGTHPGPVDQGPHIVGLQPQGMVEIGEGRRGVPETVVRRAPGRPHHGIERGELNGPLEITYRLLEPARDPVVVTPPSQGLYRIGRQCVGVVQVFDGRGILAQFGICECPAYVGRFHSGAESDSPAVVGQGMTYLAFRATQASAGDQDRSLTLGAETRLIKQKMQSLHRSSLDKGRLQSRTSLESGVPRPAPATA